MGDLAHTLEGLVGPGTWNHCVFCRQVLPERWWTQDARWKGPRDALAIEIGGYCGDCRKFIGNGVRT